MRFDLDRLDPLEFQELCNTILQKYFSPLITPFVRAGKDGLIDGMLETDPIRYSNLLDRPLAYKAPDGSDTLWIFQCKHVRNEKNREKTVFNSLKSELAKWKTKTKKPTHYILLTNVNLKVSDVKGLKELAKDHFTYFEIWHEPKISNFVAGDVALQKAYYPDRSTSLNLSIVNLDQAQNSIRQDIHRTSLSVLEKTDPKEALQILVNHELEFIKSNISFLAILKFDKRNVSPPEEWKTLTYLSKENGTLNLNSHNSQSLEWIADKIVGNKLLVTSWQTFLGEDIVKGAKIGTFSYPIELENELFQNLDSLFIYTKYEHLAHQHVDRHLKNLESEILTNLQSNKIQDAQQDLSEIIDLRKHYILLKKKQPDAQYPNSRIWGRQLILGWSFLGLWEKIFTNICDIVFSGEYPKNLCNILIRSPFSLCITAIRKEFSKVPFQNELAATHIILRSISDSKKNREFLLDTFLDALDDVAQSILIFEYEVKTSEKADWALDIAVELTSYIRELGKLSISGKSLVELKKLENILNLVTSLKFLHLDACEKGVRASLSLQHDLQKKLLLIRKECLFAWATLAWHYERHHISIKKALAIELLQSLEMKDISLFYNSYTDAPPNWLETWFIPEGKRSSWSWAVDHDIRECLQLAILSLKIKPEDFSAIKAFTNDSLQHKFLIEIKELHNRLSKEGYVNNSLSSIEDILSKSFKNIEDEFKEFIKKQNFLSSNKLEAINENFQETMNENTLENILYKVEEVVQNPKQEGIWFVGPYLIEEKLWFLENTGSTYYSVKGLGSRWADNLKKSISRLLVEKAKIIGSSNEFKLSNILDTLQSIKENYTDDYILICSYLTISWEILSKINETDKSIPFAYAISKIGNVEIFYDENLKCAEILVIPKNSFVWNVEKKRHTPDISFIDESTDESKEIKKLNPDLDLGLNVLVDAREKGFLTYKPNMPNPIWYIGSD